MIRDDLPAPIDSGPGLRDHASAKPVAGGIDGADMGRGDGQAAPLGPVIHKRRAGEGALCRRALIGSDAETREAVALIDATEATSDYWDGVTCTRCLGLRPASAPGRTSFKHSHRAEGMNFVD